MKLVKIIFSVLLLTFHLQLQAEANGKFVQPDNSYPKVKFVTSFGDITVELNRVKAPLTVNNFLTYVINGDYNNTVIHRIEPDFVIQGGGYNKDYKVLDERAPIPNESGNGTKNSYGTIAMAKPDSFDPHSATRQFFFNLDDNKHLNPGSKWGYAVFGYVVEGDDVLDKLAEVETGFNEKLGWSTVPVELVEIKQVTVLDEEKPEAETEKQTNP